VLKVTKIMIYTEKVRVLRRPMKKRGFTKPDIKRPGSKKDLIHIMLIRYYGVEKNDKRK